MNASEQNLPDVGHITRQKVLDFPKELDITDFDASQEWLDHWKNRHNPANIRLGEDVLKAYFLFFLRKRLEEVLKKSWLKPTYSPWSYVFRWRLQDILIKTNLFFLVMLLQDVLLRCLQDVFKTPCKYVFKTSSRHLQDVLKTFWRHLEDVFKIYHQIKMSLLTRL